MSYKKMQKDNSMKLGKQKQNKFNRDKNYKIGVIATLFTIAKVWKPPRCPSVNGQKKDATRHYMCVCAHVRVCV